MKTKFAFICFFIFPVLAAKAQDGNKDYLKQVLSNLQKIESADYHLYQEIWNPGDKEPQSIRKHFQMEYANPQDTTIGASFAYFNNEDTTLYIGGYDGKIHATAWHDKKEIRLDDFSTRKHPFRLVAPPFFNYTSHIIQYALGTCAHATTETAETDGEYYLKLTIEEETQVEFFGKAYCMPKSPFYIDPTSVYEVWIDKKKGLPYKVRKEMSHNTIVKTCSNAVLNKRSLKDFDLSSYFPKAYEIRKL